MIGPLDRADSLLQRREVTPQGRYGLPELGERLGALLLGKRISDENADRTTRHEPAFLSEDTDGALQRGQRNLVSVGKGPVTRELVAG